MQNVWLKRGILGLGTALALGAASIGVVAAQETSGPATQQETRESPRQHRQERREQFLEAAAEKLGVSVERVKQALREAREELARPGRPRLHRARHALGAVRQQLRDVAEALNMSPAQLRAELPGKSLAEVAAAHNVNPSGVANALEARAHARIDRAASTGRISSDRAAEMKERVSAAIDRLMGRQMPLRR